MTNIEQTIQERDERYGGFDQNARVSQELKYTMEKTPMWRDLSDDKREALEMIAHKIARILNGNPNYFDSWHDIEGYANLVSRTLKK